MIVLRTKHFGANDARARLSQGEEEAARMRMRMWHRTIFEEPEWQGVGRRRPLLGSPEDWKEIDKNIDKKKLRKYLAKLKH